MSPISSIIVFIIILSMVKLARHVQFTRACAYSSRSNVKYALA